MVEFYCPHVARSPKSIRVSAAKKEVSSLRCCDSPEEILKLQDQLREKQQQRQKRKVYLPMLLGFALLVGIIVGAIAKSWSCFMDCAGSDSFFLGSLP